MDIDAKRLSNALSDLYAATTDPQARSALAHNLAKAFDATSCLLHTRAEDSPGVTVLGATANLQALMPAYANYSYARDLWAERGARHVGRALLGEEIVTERELVGADWYNDLCKPHDIHYIVGAVFRVEHDIQGQIGVHRPPDAADFGDADRAMMDLLIPHLRRAYRLMRIVDTTTRASILSFDVLAALAVGVFVVGRDSRTLLMNAAAERIASAGSPVVLRNGRVSLSDPKLDDRLHKTVTQACLAGIGRSLCPGEEILVKSRDGHDILLLVIPLPPDAKTTGATEPLAVILAGEQTSAPEIQASIAQSVYGLTPAETRILLSLVRGQTLPEIAASCGLSINTIHSQAKAVFAKTGVRRQSELVAKVLSNPIWRVSARLRSQA
ncbi:MAG TPA: LuxR C-terminal-related transcriptional regulator [Micropepsaceae bacterium]|nr:LuxR C-terminal-related transcriptional regulator [Micropepsaceae bacterium]